MYNNTYKIIFICLLAWLNSANAIPFNLSVINTGYYDSNGDIHTPSYITGVVGTNTTHSFFVFDLPMTQSMTSPTSAILQLQTFNVTGSGTLNLFDVTTPVNTLLTGGNGLNTYNDLGSGTSYGSIAIDATQDNQIIQIALNSNALTDITTANGGLFAIGASYDSLSDFTFGFSFIGSDDNQLLLDFPNGTIFVPTPATLWFLSLGYLGMIKVKSKHKLV